MKKIKSRLFIITILIYYGCGNTVNKNQEIIYENVKIKTQIKNHSSMDSILAVIEELKIKADQAFQLDKKSKLGNSLWIDSIPSILKGNYISNTIFKDNNEDLIELSTLGKPIFIQVSSTHPNANRTEIPVINQLAKEFEKDIKFIILLCDGVERFNEKKDDYYSGISIITIDYFNCESNINIQGFKHATGYPYNYYLDKELKIMNCEIGDLEYNGSETYSEYRKRIYDKVKPNLDLLVKKTDNK